MVNGLDQANKQGRTAAFLKGLGITLLIAIIAKALSGLPFLSIMGQLVIAILLGMAWRAAFGFNETYKPGIAFANKKLLRFGIILLGMRLNLADIYEAGGKVFLIAAVNIVFALVVVYWLAKLFGTEEKLGVLTACGTAICGAAAVVAIAPQIKAKEEETAVAAAIVAILGTIFTLAYTLLYAVFNMTPTVYGVFAGGTLHEVAHVVAAAAAGGNDAVDIAVIVKLTRVALLVPVALLIGFFMQKKTEGAGGRKLSMPAIPWFIFGFIAMSGFNTLGIVSETVAGYIVAAAYLLIAMAMAALGMNVEIKTFRRLGMKAFTAGLIGSVLLSVFGYILVAVLHIQ
ncbi:YeiH family protein [Bacillus sp. B-jedd]|uniref:YeiH family protein n=1 Tax=Bacillus sp. B-jedd TaxID=1476857 RepID=UPI0005156455|nr:YeiH family protein [Bacillus sp. B-jedd]CEG29360.1 membrane spanning protein [Bacillus sp. B-jedd]